MAEDQVEGAYEERADNLEAQADEVMETAEDRIDALEDKADRMDAMSDKMGDRVEDGVLDKSEAMPAYVVDNDGNKIEEAVS